MSGIRPRKFVVVDTGPLVALTDQDDEYHATCVKWLEQALRDNKTLVIPVPVITEVCYLLKRAVGSAHEADFLEGLAQTPSYFRLFYPGRENLARMAELVRKYADLPLGMVDAAVIAAAEHFRTTEIATVDGRMAATVRIEGRYPITPAL